MPNVRYYLDTEFNSFGGSLISLALVRENGEYLYVVVPEIDIAIMCVNEGMDPWIEENVIKTLHQVPEGCDVVTAPVSEWGRMIGDFIYSGDGPPQIICDWPSDAMEFSKLLMTGPGTAVPMDNQTHITILRHIDVYPTSLEGAVQHNALWDAMAIKRYVEEARG